jgi:RimJ/RimL family protein N-acetyltransferase
MTEDGVPVFARDGSRVRIRQLHRGDRELWQRGFEHLGAESRYRRFLSPMPEASGRMARALTELDHRDHDAVVAIDEESGEGIGVARYVRDPSRPHVAELALTIVDEWQGRGIGTLLLGALCGRAREEGVRTFTALMLASNREMMNALKRLGPVRVIERQAGTVAVEVANPAAPPSPDRELSRGQRRPTL